MRYFLSVIIIVFSFLTTNAKTVSHVACLYGSSSLSVTRIEYGDEVTKVTFNSTKECGPTLKVGHGIYLVDDNGERHHAVSAEGIKFDSLYVMVKGQPRKFSVSFIQVDPSNKALDIIDPGQFRIYGLYDAGEGLSVPEVETTADKDELAFLSSGQEGDVEISGTYNSVEDAEGTVLYFDYTPFQQNAGVLADNYAKTGGDGRFSLKFHAYSPSLVFFWKGRSHDMTLPRERLYVRPGDKIELGITDWAEGKEQTARNLSGHNAYNRILNERDLIKFYRFEDFQKDSESKLAYMGYEAHHAALEECRRKDMEFANYICWHNRLSPYESRLFLNSMLCFYASHFAGLDVYVRTLYLEAKNVENMREQERSKYNAVDTVKLKAQLDGMDYAYFKLFDPDDITLMAEPYIEMAAGMLVQVEALRKCHDMVPEGDPDRWMKVIGLQQKELERIAGWTGTPFLFQMMIVEDYYAVFDWKPADEGQYRQVRELLTVPFCKRYLDLTHQKMLDMAKERN